MKLASTLFFGLHLGCAVLAQDRFPDAPTHHWASNPAAIANILKKNSILGLPPFSAKHPLSQSELLDFGERDNRNSESITRKQAVASVERYLGRKLITWPPVSQLDSKGGVDPQILGGPFLYAGKIKLAGRTTSGSGRPVSLNYTVDIYNESTGGIGNGYVGTRTATFKFTSRGLIWLSSFTDFDRSQYKSKRFGKAPVPDPQP